jgi:hypothetical protein
MGSPTSERLPTRQGKVFWDIKIHLGWIEISLRKMIKAIGYF